ncbi:hypothetical protein [Candidatus Promineifilum breve]|nr:hypothetical protein [Candidatus Promineifilum breve]
MRVHRDRAAEEITTAAMQLERLLKRIQRGEYTRVGLERDLLEATVRLQVAARHLEAAGAETVPE